MAQTYQTGFNTTLALPVAATDTTITLAVVPTVTSGRMKIGQGAVKERISYTGVSGNTITGVTRGLSLTADPATAGTGLSWLAGTKIKLVAMHDQLVDKKEDTSFTSNVTSGGVLTGTDIRFTGTTTSGLRIKSLTQTQINALTPAVGDKVFNITTGTEQTYYGGSRNDAASGTTPNASTTVAGKVEEATLTEQGSQTATGATGARLFINPVNTAKASSGASDENKIPLLDATGKLATGFIPSAPNLIEKNYVLGDTVSARDNVSLLQDGLAYKYFGDGSLTATGFTGALLNNFSGTVSLSSTSVVQWFINTAGLIQVVVGTVSGNTITYGTVNSYTPVSWGAYRGTPEVCVLSSTSFVLGFGRTTGGGTESISATAYTVSGTTITRGTEVLMTAGSSTGGVQGVGKVSATKFAISYSTSGAAFAIIAGSVSGTTITAGTSIVASIAGDVSYIADDKIAVANGSNVRLYTTSGTVITQGNNFAIGTTYTSFSMRSIGGSLCIYTGTVSTNTEAFIVDCSGATPSKGTTVTVLAASTSTDCMANGTNQVCIITGGNRYYFYNYTGTTLTAINNVTKTNSISKRGIDNLSQQKFVISSTTNGQFVSNMKIYAIGVAKASGTATQTIAVGINGGEVTGYSGLLPGLPYYSTNTGGLSTSGDFIIGKASSTTTLLVGIPYNGI